MEKRVKCSKCQTVWEQDDIEDLVWYSGIPHGSKEAKMFTSLEGSKSITVQVCLCGEVFYADYVEYDTSPEKNIIQKEEFSKFF